MNKISTHCTNTISVGHNLGHGGRQGAHDQVDRPDRKFFQVDEVLDEPG